MRSYLIATITCKFKGHIWKWIPIYQSLPRLGILQCTRCGLFDKYEIPTAQQLKDNWGE